MAVIEADQAADQQEIEQQRFDRWAWA